MIKAVFFDATGTLVHLPRGVGFHYAEVARELGMKWESHEVDRAFREAWRATPRPPAGPRPDDDKGWWRELVRGVTRRAGQSPEPFDVFFERLYARFTVPGVWELYPDVRPVLERLRGRARLAVLSNFDGRLRVVLDQLGLGAAFDDMIISSEIGADKPDPAIFREACRRVGVEPAEAIHAGDDPEDDWAGAASAGLGVFKLRRPGNSLLDLLEVLDADGRGRAGQS